LSNKLPTQIIDILRRLKTVADELNIPIILIGATARDLILQHTYNIQSNRATTDIDFGVGVSNWDEFANLKSALNKTGNFSSGNKPEHQIKDLISETPIDLIPFGEIENPRGKITLRNKNEMTTSGFVEAFESALDLKLAENLTIKVVSSVGLTLLKLVAWTDRSSNKDSQDFWLIAKNYLDLGNEERLYSEMLDLMLEDENFDTVEAGARLLGRDLSKILSYQTKEIVSAIFGNEKKLQKLASEIYQMEGSFDDARFSKILTVLESFQKGLND